MPIEHDACDQHRLSRKALFLSKQPFHSIESHSLQAFPPPSLVRTSTPPNSRNNHRGNKHNPATGRSPNHQTEHAAAKIFAGVVRACNLPDPGYGSKADYGTEQGEGKIMRVHFITR
jgi:hypothetical protein